MTELNIYVAFLYGVNIPGGVKLRTAEIPGKLAPTSDVTFIRCVGDADNILFVTTKSISGTVIARQLNRQLGLKGSVVLSLFALREILRQAEQELFIRGFPTEPPFRINDGGELWEFGLVFASEAVGSAATQQNLAIRNRKNVRIISPIGTHALLVQKRCSTDNGSRIMFGTTVIAPWRNALREKGISPECFTSRGLGRIQGIVRAGGK